MYLTFGRTLEGEFQDRIGRDRVGCLGPAPGVVVQLDRGTAVEDREIAVYILRSERRRRQRRKIEACIALSGSIID